MAITAVASTQLVPGSAQFASANFTGDAAYVQGGYLLTPQMFGLTVLRRIIESRAHNLASGAYYPVLNVTSVNGYITALFLAFFTNGAEAAAGANLSAITMHLIAEGN